MFSHCFDDDETLIDLELDWSQPGAELPKQQQICHDLVDFVLRVTD